MKRTILLLLIFALLLSFVACAKSAPPPTDEQQTQSSEPVESNSEPSTESESEIRKTNCDFPLYRRFTVNDYELYKEHIIAPVIDAPKNFVSFEDIKDVGNVQFVEHEEYWYTKAPLDCMRYRLGIMIGYSAGYSQSMSITVLHGDLSEPTLTEEVKKEHYPAIYFREDYPVVTDHEGDDLRYYSGGSETVDYFCNGIRYTYEKGNLTEIHWQSGDTKFWFTFDEPLYAPTYSETDQGSLTHPLLSRFLNKDQTATAISWFDEVVATDEVTPSN